MDSTNLFYPNFAKKKSNPISEETKTEVTCIKRRNGKDFLNSRLKIFPTSVSDINNQNTNNSVQEEVSVVVTDNKKKVKANNSKYKMLSQAGLSFLPGSKLEAKDFNEKWYSARVVETDWIEREVLIHFDKWSSRFDEWIPMDSSRLRILQNHSKEPKLKEFAVGEKILATWADGKKYPAKVIAVVESDKYDVLFDDGYSKILKTSKMTKLVGPSASTLEEDSYVGSKQERRDKKRKHTITELFHSHSKKKVKHDSVKMYKKQDVTVPHSIKFISKTESLNNLINTELESEIQVYKNTDSTTKTKKAKREIFKCNNAYSEHTITKLTDKNVQENILGDVEDDYATFIGNLRIEIEDHAYKCPKVSCNKNFRKENLLQMHIKHYHPEYSKFLGSTPNVADLAYARTIGESVEDLTLKKSRFTTIHSTQTMHEIPPSITHMINLEIEDDNKLENKFNTEKNCNGLGDILSEQSNNCTMSPGTLFHMRFKEDKISHSGIKTLPPVRHASVSGPIQAPGSGSDDSEQLHFSNMCNDQKTSAQIDKSKLYRSKHHYYRGSMYKVKKQNSISENEDGYHYDENLLDRDNVLNLKYKYNISNSQPEIENNDSIQSKNDNIMIINGELVKVEKLRKEEIINCTCGIIEEDGLMIQCDLCLCWQHGHCNSIEKEKDVPEKYICYICEHAHRQRDSKKHFHDQGWICEGKLPSLFSYATNIFKSNQRTAMLKRSYDLIAGLLEVQDLLRSIKIKVSIAQNKDHPKLYLWAKNWNKVNILTSKTEPILIMEIIKGNNSNDDNLKDTTEEKLEFCFSINHDSHRKLISSDTELMKILEEDSTQGEETKSLTKYSLSNYVRDEGRILLDALTKNGLENKEQQKLLINNESNYDFLQSSYSIIRNVSSDKFSKSQLTTPQVRIKSSNISQPIVPQPEALIETIECKLHLLQHIGNFQNYIDSTLSFVEVQLIFLENMNISEKQNNNEHIKTKQTIQMILHDLESIQKLAELC